MKRVPSYWWDFHWEGDKITSIDVESNDPSFPIVKSFPPNQIELAEKLIDDLKAGRVDPRRPK